MFYLAILFLFFILFFALILWYITLPIKKKNIRSTLDINNPEASEKIQIYFKKDYFMTASELDFYNKFKELESSYKIVPQLCLGTIIDKKDPNNKFRNELNRYIDFAIFSNDYKELLLLIELNDSTHNKTDRIIRDSKVKTICKEAEIPIITFYTKCSNEQEYVINRIKKELNNTINI